MAYQIDTPLKENQLLLTIREGTPIYDWDDKKVGTVKFVQFPNDSIDGEFAEGIAYLTNLDKVPQDEQLRLLRQGFIHASGGFFAPDRYITPDQILGADEKHVILNVLVEELT